MCIRDRTDTIPSELKNLANLVDLSLFGNQLTGKIPPELGQLTNLISLTVESNKLSGTIPPELGNLINLYRLNLGNNQLIGTIPSEFGNLINLTELFLYGNQLSGCFPPELNIFCEIAYNFLGNADLPNNGDFTVFCENNLGSCSETTFDSLGGEYFRKQVIVQLDTTDFPLSERQVLRDSFQANVLDTCLCGQLELWEMPDNLVLEGVPLIDIEDRKEKIRMRTKIEDADANYVVSFGNKEAQSFQANQPTQGIIGTRLADTKVRIAILDSGIDDKIQLSDKTDLSQFFWRNRNNTGPADENCMDDPAGCLLYTSPSPRDLSTSRMPSSA